jgi:hypothetical protein
MADATPAEGSWYVLKATYGDSHGAVPKGARCQVTHVLPPGSPGAGVLDADVVIVRYLERSDTTGRMTQRRFSVRLADFADMFTEAPRPLKDIKEWNAMQKTKPGGA